MGVAQTVVSATLGLSPAERRFGVRNPCPKSASYRGWRPTALRRWGDSAHQLRARIHPRAGGGAPARRASGRGVRSHIHRPLGRRGRQAPEPTAKVRPERRPAPRLSRPDGLRRGPAVSEARFPRRAPLHHFACYAPLRGHCSVSREGEAERSLLLRADTSRVRGTCPDYCFPPRELVRVTPKPRGDHSYPSRCPDHAMLVAVPRASP